MSRIGPLPLVLATLMFSGCASSHLAKSLSEKGADPVDPTPPDCFQAEYPQTVGYFSDLFTEHQADPLQIASLPADPFRLPLLKSTTLHDQATTARSVTLPEIEASALANAASILAARATISKADGLRRQVGMKPNPNVGYSAQQLVDRGTDQHTAFWEQAWVRGDKLRLNQNVLQHTQQAQQAETTAQEYRVLTDVRLLFYQALAAQQQQLAIEAFAEVASRGVRLAEQRRAAGEGNILETLQAKTLLSEVTLAAEQAEIAFQTTWESLAVMTGIPREPMVRLEGQFRVDEDAAIDWERVAADLLYSSPELQVAQAIVREKQALLRRQQMQPIPNLTTLVGAGYDREQDHGMINIQVAAPLPVRNRNQGNIAAAHADYVRATQEVARITQSLETRLAQVAREHQTALAAVIKYDEEIMPQAEQSLELSELAYQAGELDFLQVLIVRRGYYEASLKLIDARAQLAQAKSRLDGRLLSGGMESPIDYTAGDGLRGFSFTGD